MEYLKNQNKTPTATRIGRSVHSPPLVSIARKRLGSTTSKKATAQQAQGGGGKMCTIRFCFGISRVLDHSLWYADRLVAQLNGCASSTSQAYAPILVGETAHAFFNCDLHDV